MQLDAQSHVFSYNVLDGGKDQAGDRLACSRKEMESVDADWQGVENVGQFLGKDAIKVLRSIRTREVIYEELIR